MWTKNRNLLAEILHRPTYVGCPSILQVGHQLMPSSRQLTPARLMPAHPRRLLTEAGCIRTDAMTPERNKKAEFPSFRFTMKDFLLEIFLFWRQWRKCLILCNRVLTMKHFSWTLQHIQLIWHKVSCIFIKPFAYPSHCVGNIQSCLSNGTDA